MQSARGWCQRSGHGSAGLKVLEPVVLYCRGMQTRRRAGNAYLAHMPGVAGAVPEQRLRYFLEPRLRADCSGSCVCCQCASEQVDQGAAFLQDRVGAGCVGGRVCCQCTPKGDGVVHCWSHKQQPTWQAALAPSECSRCAFIMLRGGQHKSCRCAYVWLRDGRVPEFCCAGHSGA